MDAPKNLTVSLLYYDIPEWAKDWRGRKFRNPSRRLETAGAVRVNLSVWMIPNHLIPYTLLSEMREAGCNWRKVKFDVSESAQIAEIAAQAIAKDLLAAVASARKSEQLAAVAAAEAEIQPGETMDAYLKRVKGIIKRNRDKVKRLTRTATNFGLDESRINTLGAFQSLQGIQSLADTKAKLWGDAIRKARSLGWNGSAMAGAAMADAMPIGIMADFLDDHGIDTEALRLAFRLEISGVYA